MCHEKMQVKFEYGCGSIIIGEVIALGLRKLYLVYRCIMKGCRLSSNMGVVRLLLEEVAFSYIFSFQSLPEGAAHKLTCMWSVA
jgi:hypothetical protein